MSALLSSAIFAEISVGPNCGAEPHLSWWFDNTQTLKGSQEFLRGMLTHRPPGSCWGRCEAYWACSLPQSPRRCRGRWLEFCLEKVNKVFVVSEGNHGSQRRSIPRATARNKMSSFLHVSDTENISQNFFYNLIAPGLEPFTYYIKPSSIKWIIQEIKVEYENNQKQLETAQCFFSQLNRIKACIYIIKYH